MSFRDGEIKHKKPKSIIEQQAKKELEGIIEQEETSFSQYEAFKKVRDSQAKSTLEINQKGNKTLQIYYFDIAERAFENDNLLMIMTSRKIISIEGKHISSIKTHMREQRIVSINEFDPLKYLGLPGSNEPLIETITVEEITKEKESVF